MMNQPEISVFGLVVLFAWVPAILIMFALMRPRWAVITAFVVGYLFLPEQSFRFQTIPPIDKVSLTALGAILGSFIFDGGRLLSVRWRLIDLAWFVLLTSPFATSMVNGLGPMDGIAASLTLLFRWGLAYWIGRAYFTDWEAVRHLAMGIILGGLAYVPLCWWEIRMSPQLHGELYGMTFLSFRTDSYLFGVKLFGWRPNVFLADGLRVTMFMGVCSVLAFWAWMTGSPRKLLFMPMGWIALVLIVTTFFCKALGGVMLMSGGMSVLLMTRWWPKTRLAALLLILAAPTYMAVRSARDWSGDTLTQMANVISPTRAESFAFRLKMENLLTEKALERPILGWGGWNRSHVYDIFDNHDRTIVDGLWIITLGEFGFVGLGALTIMIIGSVLLVWWRIPTRFWNDPACAAAVSLSVVLALYMIDSLFNATFNPVASLAVGAVATIGGLSKTVFSRRNLAQAADAERTGRSPAARPAAARAGFAGAPAFAGAGNAAVIASPKDLPYVYSPRRS
ncbi:MAG TPA: hypothetical protein VGI81_18045 [Tepidisphaeraceae bacterium]|jgi:hypothetical protein